MSFTGLDFARFMLAVYALYLLLGHRGQNLMLLIAGYVFYATWEPRYLWLLWFSTLVDYGVGRALATADDPRIRRRYLLVSLSTQLGILAVFKYLGFLARTANDVLAAVGVSVALPVTSIVIPVGVSFYTFQTMAYTIDVYRRQAKTERSLLRFSLYASFFPQLCAGPIERPGRLLPQIRQPRILSWDATARGLFLILFGLFKKVVISDGIAPSVAAIYSATVPVSRTDILLATYAFALQIYCDFSGYTDIARGLAKLLGIELVVNFRRPYFAVNPSDFWQRWHISLSTWLRDYLYIPLGGNREGNGKTYRNLMVTMVLGGLWHGAAWNFVLWGFFHGMILCVHRMVSELRGGVRGAGRVGSRIVRIALFFQVTCYGWLLFRAQSLRQIVDFTRALLPWTPAQASIGVPRPPLGTVVGILLLMAWECIEDRAEDVSFYRRWPAAARGAVYAVLVFVLMMGATNEPAQFIYFQF